jgi:hypothetical protein
MKGQINLASYYNRVALTDRSASSPHGDHRDDDEDAVWIDMKERSACSCSYASSLRLLSDGLINQRKS